MNDPLRIAIAGLGTVGIGVIKLLDESDQLIAQRGGRPIEIGAVSARNRKANREIPIDRFKWWDDALALAKDPDTDVFVELIGGADGIALQAVRAALHCGKHVVTANKALIALHGVELARLAEQHKVTLRFEASVAGGVPIIKTLREGLVANRISRIYGILNGTCNYILTNMEATGRDFQAVLSEAQAQGYAEADPAFDVGGIDTAHKLAILSSLAFGCETDFASIYIEGIENISTHDIAVVRELGYRIKLLGLASMTEHGVEQRVHPCLVPQNRPIAAVDHVTNAIVVDTDQAGRIVLEGPGAGQAPTASAVIADLVDLACGHVHPAFMVPADSLKPMSTSPMAHHVGAYYLRLTALDKPGVMAAITEDLAEEGVSLESIIQRGAERLETVPIILVTHKCQESVMKRALARIEAHDSIVRPPRMIRIEPL